MKSFLIENERDRVLIFVISAIFDLKFLIGSLVAFLFCASDLFLDTVASMDIALSEHQRQLRSALGPCLLLEFLEEVAYDLSLLVSAVVRHASHGDGNLLSSAETPRSTLIQLDHNEMVIDLEYFLEVCRLELWRQFAT